MELERLNPQQFERFRDFIYRTSGIRIDERKVALLSNRIRRRLRAGKYTCFDDYYRFLTSRAGVGELKYFLDAITTNETSFFRTPDHFEWLQSQFIPALVAAKYRGQREPTLRIWSAGCASGAEVYSSAICLAENAFRLRDWSTSILGTDISQEQLELAQQGHYMARDVEGVSERRLRRFFKRLPEPETWQVRPAIREMVDFKVHNLLKPIGQPPFDCIFIRNVLIYFDRNSKQAVVDRLVKALAPEGYLVIGPSEGIHDCLGALTQRASFLFQKP